MPRRKEHRFNEGIEETHCVICDTWKPLEAYHKDKSRWDNLATCCKTCCIARKKKQRATEEGRERLRAQNRKYQKKRQMNGKRNAYNRKRYKENATYRTLDLMRRRIRSCFSKHGVRKTAKTSELMGCTPEFLNNHLEKYFDDQMSWKNHGEWHIDHIIPCCAFGISIEEQKVLHWYQNLRPMWAKDNLSKNGAYKEEDKTALIKRYNRVNNTNLFF